MLAHRHARLLALLLMLALLPVGQGRAALVPRGGEFRVNTTTQGNQFAPTAAIDADGDFVVAWTDSENDRSVWGVFAQRYGADGNARGGEIRVNTYTIGDQEYPSVAMDATGNFVVVWESDGQSGFRWSVHGQRYGVDGSRRGGEFQVNTVLSAGEAYPVAAMDTDGDFVVIWQRNDQSGDQHDIYGQRYGADGSRRGGEFRVNSFTANEQVRPAVAMDASGNFVVSWVSAGQDGSGNAVYARRYAADGTARGDEFRVNSFTLGDQVGPVVAMDPSGNFVVSWESFGQVRDGVGIYGQRYGADGSPRGDEFRVNPLTDSALGSPAVAMDASGNFVASWMSTGQGEIASGMHGQRYGSDGSPRGERFPIGSSRSFGPQRFAAAMGADGDFVVTWDTSSGDIAAQRFAQAPDLELGAAAVQPVVLFENQAASIPFTVNSTRTAAENLVLSTEVLSDINGLLTPGSLAITGSGVNRTLTITPRPTNGLDRPASRGIAQVRLTASDPGNGTSAEEWFVVEVRPPPWLVMLYLAGDDAPGPDSLSGGAEDILAELRQMPYNPAMRLVILSDGNQAGGGDTRAYVRDPAGLTQITPALGGSTWPSDNELDTGDRRTLSKFVAWATATFPGYQHSMLAIMDHGGGWAPDFTAGGAQPSAGRKVKSGGWRGMSLDLSSPGGGTTLSTRDTGQALRDGLSAGQRIDVLFFDACLMGMLESAYEVRDSASFLVAAQNLLFQEEDLRSYGAYLDPAALTPATTPEQLARLLVARHNLIDRDGRLVSQPANPFTIAAIDLTKLEPLAQQVKGLTSELIANYPDGAALYQALLPAYQQVQKFDYDSDERIEPSDGYVDLGHLAALLRDDAGLPTTVRAAAGEVASAVTAAVVAQRTVSGGYRSILAGRQRWNLDGSTGLSIFAPLGEEDWRPTRTPAAGEQLPPGCEAVSEDQLAYYIEEGQLDFTSTNGPGVAWGEVLTRARPSVPVIHAPCRPLSVAALAADKQVDATPFYSPGRQALRWGALLPLVER